MNSPLPENVSDEQKYLEIPEPLSEFHLRADLPLVCARR
jgi:hypothetical protein